MFDNFQEAVRLTYLSLKANDNLHFDSEIPSTGVLKKWCLQTFQKGLSQNDEQVFNLFFERINTEDCLERIIKKTDPDKFRPLRNFIAGTTKSNPDERLVKLLAILIDFKPRPYRSFQWNGLEKTKPIISSPEITITDKYLPINISSSRKIKPYPWRPLRFLIISLLVGLAAYPKAKKCNCFIKQQYLIIQCKDSTAPSVLIRWERPEVTNPNQSSDVYSLLDNNKKGHWKINRKQENRNASLPPLHFTLSINVKL